MKDRACDAKLRTVQDLVLITVNARSVLNKVEELENVLLDYEPDIAAITETWLSADISSDEIFPPNYSVIRKDRPSRGGGVAILIKKPIQFVVLPNCDGTEAVFCNIVCDGCHIFVGCLYRSPSSDHECIVATQEFMQIHVRNSRVVLLGDFNLSDIDWGSMNYNTAASSAFIDLMFNFNLQQIVLHPTRIQGETSNILDLILVSHHFHSTQHTVDIIEGISDHGIPMCRLPLGCRIRTKPAVTTVLNFKKADGSSILSFLAHEHWNFSEMASQPTTDVNSLWLQFRNIVSYCIANFIPVKHKRGQTHNPWITREVIQAKRRVKRLRRSIKIGNDPAAPLKLSHAVTKFKQKSKDAKHFYFNTTLPSFITNSPNKF